ncbi:MAG: GGDEF domain-containing protein [Acidimicrobiales bacterium]|jgi:hypothetical protein
MPRPENCPSNSLNTKLAIACGLVGFTIGVLGLATGTAVPGLIAGILALASPVILFTGSPSRTMAANVVDAALESVEDDKTSAAESGPPANTSPFHQNGGLLTAGYFQLAVQTRVTAARRFLKPLSVAQLRVQSDDHASPTDEIAITSAIVSHLRDSDTACAMNATQIGLVLEDTPENGAVWAVERIRRAMAETHPNVRISAGIACYPAHAIESDEVMAQADEALARVEEWPQNRIEVALAD